MINSVFEMISKGVQNNIFVYDSRGVKGQLSENLLKNMFYICYNRDMRPTHLFIEEELVWDLINMLSLKDLIDSRGQLYLHGIKVETLPSQQVDGLPFTSNELFRLCGGSFNYNGSYLVVLADANAETVLLGSC